MFLIMIVGGSLILLGNENVNNNFCVTVLYSDEFIRVRVYI